MEKHILSFKEVELLVEVSLQSVIQLMMILIHKSETAQATGLDAVFKDNKDPTVYQTEETIQLAPMEVLAPGSANARPSAQPPIDTSGNFPAHMSTESPSNISPNL